MRSTTDVVATSFQFLTHCGSIERIHTTVIPLLFGVTVADSLEK